MRPIHTGNGRPPFRHLNRALNYAKGQSCYTAHGLIRQEAEVDASSDRTLFDDEKLRFGRKVQFGVSVSRFSARGRGCKCLSRPLKRSWGWKAFLKACWRFPGNNLVQANKNGQELWKLWPFKVQKSFGAMSNSEVNMWSWMTMQRFKRISSARQVQVIVSVLTGWLDLFVNRPHFCSKLRCTFKTVQPKPSRFTLAWWHNNSPL